MADPLYADSYSVVQGGIKNNKIIYRLCQEKNNASFCGVRTQLPIIVSPSELLFYAGLRIREVLKS
jgi:hypothetical protein